MDKNGFLPPHPCKSCGKMLRGQDSGFPAELYLGTYTGKCYSCTNAGITPVKTLACGITVYSHPPHCPSYRRDRETYYQQPNPCTCNYGAVYKSQGCNSWLEQCTECETYYRNVPSVKLYFSQEYRLSDMRSKIWALPKKKLTDEQRWVKCTRIFQIAENRKDFLRSINEWVY